jgi:spoIIIJ-associated protein
VPDSNGQHDDEVERQGRPPTAEEVDTARTVVEEILSRMGMEATVEVAAGDDAVLAELDGPDAGRLIGRQGQTLDALQYVINRMIRDPEDRAPVYLDVAGYRARRKEMLEAMALRLADKAIAERRPVTVEPMSPRDRRTMHVVLAKVPGVTTRSRGEGEDRQLQIFPATRKR